MKRKKIGLSILFLLLVPTIIFSMERRQEQFHSEPAYLLLPLPYSIPGVGEGILYSAIGANLLDTYTDVFAMAVAGDATGYVFGIHDLHLIKELLFLDYHSEIIDKASVQAYENRGIDSEKDEYNFYELNKWEYRKLEAWLTFFDRKLEFYAGMESMTTAIKKIRNNDEEVVTVFDDPVESKEETRFYGAIFDYTDDHSDAKEGFRLKIETRATPPDNDNEAKFNVNNYSASVYLPLGDTVTMAMNYQISHANVTRQGETDPEKIREELGLDCASYDTCKKEDKQLINNKIAARKYGTAKSLGGESLMRAYPDGRFEGAHMNYFSTELRWNFVSEVTPIDFWIWKDISTSMQLAFFYEAGSVAENSGDLNEDIATDVGVGLRVVAASGFVYRADYATSDEGSNLTVMVMYPW